jgi:hypothetical protein
MEVAHLKRQIRRNFDVKMNKALAKTSDKCNRFGELANALQQTSHSPSMLLEIADRIPFSHTSSQSDRHVNQQTFPNLTAQHIFTLNGLDEIADATPAETGAQQKHTNKRSKLRERRAIRKSVTLMQSHKGVRYIANRIAKLMLELLWRTVTTRDLCHKPVAMWSDRSISTCACI